LKNALNEKAPEKTGALKNILKRTIFYSAETFPLDFAITSSAIFVGAGA
jgi:hypothetical protein